MAAEGPGVALLPLELRPAPVPLPAATDPERRRAWEQVIAPRAAALGLEVRAVPAYIEENGSAARSRVGLPDPAELKPWLEQER